MKRILVVLLTAGILSGAYYGARLIPLLFTDNTGAEKVALLHGLGRSESAMLLLESALTEAGFDVYSIGYPSTDQPPEALVETISEEINRCCANQSASLHLVGHSLGGLLIRAYLAENRPTNLGHVVLLGTPNKGSEIADAEPADSIQASMLEMAGPTARALGTGTDSFPASLPLPDYSIGIIAGTRDTRTGNQWLPIPNDGLVSVESARLENMSDFITFDVSHWNLRNDRAVAEQVVAFLREGRFDRKVGQQ